MSSGGDPLWVQRHEPPNVAGGEPLQAYLDRRMREDPFLRELKARAARLRPPSLEKVHPADWTAVTWADRWPTEWPHGEKELPSQTFAEARWKALKWGFERGCYRIMLDLFDQWARGDLRLLGRRADGAMVPVPPDLRDSRFMVLHVRNGLLVPAHWRGQAPPADLELYSDLTVCPAERRELPPLVRTAGEVSLPESESELSADLPEPATVAGPPRDTAEKLSKAASDEAIRRVLRAVYLDQASDPPNIKQIAAPVQARLKKLKLKASGRRIMAIAEENEFSLLRRRSGVTRRAASFPVAGKQH